MRCEAKDFKGGRRCGSAHSIGLVTALELGHEPGHGRPGEVTVFAIEAEDVETFGGESSPAIAEPVLARVREESGAS